MPEDHSRPKQSQATSAAGNNDPRKDVPKSRPTTTSSGEAKIKRISQVKEINAKATATHATPRMPQSQQQAKSAIGIKEVKTQASPTYAASSRLQRPQSQPVAAVKKGAVRGSASIDWGPKQFPLPGLALCLPVLNSIGYGIFRASKPPFVLLPRQ
jgi:hypothetical protein